MQSLPRVMIFPITMTCNSRCRSCGIWRLPLAAKAHAEEVLLKRVIADPFLTRHVESVNISGGEPFAHPGLTPFLSDVLVAYDNVREVCINTDGHLIEEIESMLAATAAPCAADGTRMRMYISLDGIGEHHDRHRRHTGAFAQADRALRRLAELRAELPHLRVTASFTITNQNVEAILPVFEYVKELGVRVDFNLAARPEVFIGGAGLGTDFQIKPDQVAQVESAIKVVAAEPEYSNFSPAFYATMLETLSTGRRKRGCFFPDQGFVLMPDGRVYICGTYLDFYFGDFNVEDFETLWNGVQRTSCRNQLIPSKCESCFSNSYEDWDLVVGALV